MSTLDMLTLDMSTLILWIFMIGQIAKILQGTQK